MNPSATAVIATLSALYGPQADRRMDRRQFFRVTGGAAGSIVTAGFLAHPLLQAAVLDRPDDLILLPGDVTSTEPILFQTEMYDLARQFAMLCGQRWNLGGRLAQPLTPRQRGELLQMQSAPLARRPVTVFVGPGMTPLEWDAMLHPQIGAFRPRHLSEGILAFETIDQLPRIASMDDETVETGIAIDPITGLTARASRSLVADERWDGRDASKQTIVQLEIIGRQVGVARIVQ